MDEKNLWAQVANKCLKRALTLLDAAQRDPLDTDEIQRMVQIAIDIDRLNLQWEQQNQSAKAVFGGRLFEPQA